MSDVFFLNSSKMNTTSCGCANTQHIINGGGKFETQHTGGSVYLDQLANLVIPMSLLVAQNFLKKKDNLEAETKKGGGDIRNALTSLGNRIEGILNESSHLKSG
jgi:hypothetical protein